MQRPQAVGRAAGLGADLCGANEAAAPTGRTQVRRSSDSSEVQDRLDAVGEISRPRRVHPSRRRTAAENKAIEKQAVHLVCRYFAAQHYVTTDVGATESYDVRAVRAGQVIKIEVKGTTSDGSEIILTYNEVELHEPETQATRSQS
nr:DUF3883 domain-containing protein [Mycolicibacterium sediminis]